MKRENREYNNCNNKNNFLRKQTNNQTPEVKTEK